MSTSTADFHVPPSTDEKYHQEIFGKIHAKAIELDNDVAPPREGLHGTPVTNVHHELKYFEEGKIKFEFGWGTGGQNSTSLDIENARPFLTYQVINNMVTINIPPFTFKDDVTTDTVFLWLPPRLRPVNTANTLDGVLLYGQGRATANTSNANVTSIGYYFHIRSNGTITVGSNDVGIRSNPPGEDPYRPNNFMGGSITYPVPNTLR